MLGLASLADVAASPRGVLGVECQSCKGFYAAIHSWGTATMALPTCGHIRGAWRGGRALRLPASLSCSLTPNLLPLSSLHTAAADAAGGAGPAGGGGAPPQSEHMRQDASRHRYIHEPPPSPTGFWNMDFTPAPRPSQ